MCSQKPGEDEQWLDTGAGRAPPCHHDQNQDRDSTTCQPSQQDRHTAPAERTGGWDQESGGDQSNRSRGEGADVPDERCKGGVDTQPVDPVHASEEAAVVAPSKQLEVFLNADLLRIILKFGRERR